MAEAKKCDSPEEAVADLRVRLDKSTHPMERLYFQVQIALFGPLAEILKAMPTQTKSEDLEMIASAVGVCWAGTIAGSILSSVPDEHRETACCRMAAAMADGFMDHMGAIIAVRVPDGIADMAPEGRA